jgi:hypothetical protein
VRTATNTLTAAVWFGILSAITGLFSGGFWNGFVNGLTAGFDWSFTTTAGIIVTILFAVLGLIHGVKMAKAESYFGAGGFFAFLWDHLWSLPNTILGSIFALVTVGIAISKPRAKDGPLGAERTHL